MLVKAASEIQQDKENCLESGSSSMCGVLGSKFSGNKSMKACHCCNTTSHSRLGFDMEVRKKHCKAFNIKCGKCQRMGHFTEFCRKGYFQKKKEAKKAKVNVVSTTRPAAIDIPAVVTTADTQAVAALNSVQQAQREYFFDSARYGDDFGGSGDYWSVTARIPIQVQRLWCKMEASTASQPLGHYIYNNVQGNWRRNAPPSHAAKKV